MGSVPYRFLAFIMLAVCATTVALAQSGGTPKPEQSDQQRAPTFRTEANFVRVDVYPTKDGKPVQDLKAEDFEVFEDGAPQAIQSFEHILIRPAGPQDTRTEPNTIEESRQMAANPRNRLFVLFLDTPNVSVEGGWHAREPLVRLIDRILGPDDLVGIMTPRMAAADVVFARKTEVIASGLRARWPWGERNTLQRDETEQMYEICYPPLGAGQVSRTAAEMTARKRERATLDSMKELVNYLRDLREGRKAIITVSEGWLLYRPNSSLTNLESGPAGTEPMPHADPISVGPDGRLTTKNIKGSAPYSKTDCDADRQALAMIDDEQYFREITDEANRGNATFYTVDPRGLPALDATGAASFLAPMAVDARILRSRIDSLRGLAGQTDGMAVLNNNDLDTGMKRISDDLSSYYLLGYYSTNGKLDGQFHNIKVRVKRPGVDVRARRGYRAATATEVTRARAAAAAPGGEAAAALTAAMSSLSRIRPDSRMGLNAVALKAGGSATPTAILVAGELPATTAGGEPMRADRTVEVTVSAGGRSSSAQVTLGPGDRSFSVSVPVPVADGATSLDVRARMLGAATSVDALTAVTSVALSGSDAQPMVFRRGPATGNRLVPAASFLFSRTERVRFEFATKPDTRLGAGRLLDRTGQPLAIPVAVSERTDDKSGQHWTAADITLAALAAGDYALELTVSTGSGTERLLTALRVGR
jgi:VWFA-related protein